MMLKRSWSSHVPSFARRCAMLLALAAASGCADLAPRTPEPNAQHEALVGRFEAYVVDHADGSSRAAHALRLDSGERVELVFTEPQNLLSGERVSLRGRYLPADRPLSTRDGLRLGTSRFQVAQVAASSLSRTQQALVSPPNVTVTSAVILLNFDGMVAQSYSADDARRELDEVHDYYQEISYGSWTMNADVFGPYTVATPAQCDLGALGDLAKATARAQGVDVDAYDHVGVKIGGIPGADCPCAVAFLGNTPAQGAISNGGVSLYTCGGANVYAHEMGHGIGLHHSATAPCSGVGYRPGLAGCDIVEYGNRFNTMGGGLGHFNAMQKATMGWLNGCNMRRVARDGEFDLTAIQLAADDQTQGLQIDTGDTLSGGPLYFYVEYRNPALAQFNARKDDGTPRERGPGLHVTVSRDFRSGQGEGRTILIDASNGLKGLPTDGSDADQARGDPRLLVGETFAPNDRVRIEFVSQTDQVARVKVTFSGGGSGESECQQSEVPLGPDDVPEGFAAAIYQDCAYAGGWSANLREGRYTRADLAALGALDDDASSLLLRPGYDAVLYEDDEFGGRSVTRRSSLGCFTQIGMNDALSSIEIVSNGSVPPDDDAGVSPGDGSGDGAPDGDGHVGDGSTDRDGEPAADGSEGDGAEADAGDVSEVDPGAPTQEGGCALTTGAGSSFGSWSLLVLAFALRARRRRHGPREVLPG